MELRFLGRGGAFFVEEGNTAAFFIENKTLFLIDCGESVFSKIVQTGLLKENQIEDVICFITHLHGDHVGSLSSLIYYCYYSAYTDIKHRIRFSIVCHSCLINELCQMLRPQGCTGLFNCPTIEILSWKYQSFSEAKFIRTVHQGQHPAFCIEFKTANGIVFYSGDTSDLELIRSYVQKGEEIERMYLEVTLLDYPGNVHLPLNALDEMMPKSLRQRVYLMHFNSAECIAKAEELGFQVVECIKETNHG